MLHANFGPNPFSSSGEENFESVFTIYGHGGHLEKMDLHKNTNFNPPFAQMFDMKYEPKGPNSFLLFESAILSSCIWLKLGAYMPLGTFFS